MATVQPLPTINVVPAGYRWNQEKAQKAANAYKFIRVGGKSTNYRLLSGAPTSWKSTDPKKANMIYSLDYRIAGTPEDVQQALLWAGFSQDQVNGILANAITRNNFDARRAEVEREIANHKAAEATKEEAPTYPLESIVWFANNLKSAVPVDKSGQPKGGVVVGGKGVRGESIIERVNKLSGDKVLDVSNMDIATGKGVRQAPRPKTAKSGKFFAGNIPVISNDAERYAAALDRIYGADARTKYANEIATVREYINRHRQGAVAVPAAAVPALTAFRPPSPRGIPGATLAPVPTVVPARAGVTTPRIVPTVGANQFQAIPPLGTVRQ